MNRIHSLVWSIRLNTWIVAHEHAVSRGKSASIRRLGRGSAALLSLLASVISSTIAYALPVGPQVANGSATISQSGNALTINNSNGAILNWQKFNIGANESVRFNQPSATSSVLNRVLANDPSVIYGQLSSNGRVWLINPAGIMVGASGRIDVAGFVASTLNVTNADFLANRLNFQATPGAGNVINQGSITTPTGGSVYLVGANVSNEGIITTPKGETLLAAGETVQLIDSATPGVKVEITGAANNATNLGTITAEAGRIGIAGALVKNIGTLSASSAVSEGGRIFLKASKTTLVEGSARIEATGTKGGQIDLFGDHVGVTDLASIDASGETGGGKVRIGGDFQGKNPDVQNATATYLGTDTTIKVNATKVGAGGTAIIWADDTTRAYGSVEAKGGAAGGDGGFVETSGKRALDIAGARVDASALLGSNGQWLLDPSDVTIIHGTAGVLSSGLFDPATSSNIGDTEINAALNGGTSVTIQTSAGSGGTGAIVVNGTADGGGAVAISNTAGGARGLTLTTAGTINIHSGASIAGSAGNALDVTLDAAGGSTIAGTIDSLGGTISLIGAASLSGGALKNGTLTGTTLSSSGGALVNVVIGSNLTQSGDIAIGSDLTLANGVTYDTGSTVLYFSDAAGSIKAATGTATLRKAGGLMYVNSANNAGVITIANGITLEGYGSINNYYSGGGLINEGIINANVSGQTMHIATPSFTNNRTITASAGSVNLVPTNLTLGSGSTLNVSGGALDLNPANGWNNSTGNLNLSAGTLNLYKTFSLGSLGTYSRTGGTLNVRGTLDLLNSATPLDISSSGALGTGGLGILYGAITNGTITGTTLSSSGGALVNVVIGSNLTQIGDIAIGSDLTLANGVTYDTGSTVLYFSDAAGSIKAATGTATLRKAGGLMYVNSANNAGVITIANGITLEGYGSINNYYSGGGLINEGIINANVSGQTMHIATPSFTNNRTITASAGSVNLVPTNLTLGSGSTLNVSGGALDLNPANGWNNSTGNLNLSAGTLNLYKTFSLGSLGTYSRTGGTLNVRGTLDLLNSATPLDISSSGALGTGGLGILYGAITNGTITGTTLSSSGGALVNVVIGSNLTQIGDIAIGSDLTLANGVTYDTGSTVLYFSDAAGSIKAATGTATLRKAGGLMYVNSANNAGVITIANGITLEGYGSINNYYSGGGLINEGIINANVSGQTMHIATPSFTNNRTITASAGSVNLVPTNLTLGSGSTLNVSGGALDLNPANGWNNSTGNLNLSAGTLNLYKTFSLGSLGTYSRTGGTLNVRGTLDLLNSATPLDISSSGALGTGGLGILYGAITNGTITGTTLSSSGGALVNVVIGSNLTQIGDIAIGSDLTLANGVTYDTGSTVLYFSDAAGSIKAATGTATLRKAGGLMYVNSANNAGVITIANGITLEGYGSINNYYSGGGLINEGIINANVSGQTMHIATPSFTNNGSLNIASGALIATGNRSISINSTRTLSGSGTLDLGGSAYTLTNNGTIAPGGSGAAGTLTINGNLVEGATGQLSLDLGGTTAGQSDRLAVTGDVTLAGALSANALAGYTPSNADAITVLTRTGTTTGTFTTTTGLPAGFSAGYNLFAGEATRLIYATPGWITFTNAVGGLTWETPGNWSGGNIPGMSDTALIVSGSGYAVTHGSGTDSIAGLTINVLNSLDITGGSLAVSGTTSGAGTLSVSGGTLTLNGTSSIGAFNYNSGTITQNGALSTTTFTQTGGTWSQVAATLPSFTATDFRLNGGTFIRAKVGDGNTATPYQLTDIYGVQGMGSAGMLGKSYVLANNIEAATMATWNTGEGFKPIGAFGSPFLGTLDGQNHTINGLYINRPSTDYVGLFGVNGGGVLNNVGLDGGQVTGYTNVGQLVGYNTGSIGNSYATGSVSGGNGSGGLGGLVGKNAGAITQSYATGSVSGTADSSYAGGLVGENVSGGAISQSYATGAVSAFDFVGGLVGRNDGAITSSYSTGNINGILNSEKMGGLVGMNWGGSITRSYSLGSVISGGGGGVFGGSVGVSGGGATITQSFYNKTANPSLFAISGTASDTVGEAYGMTATDMKSWASFTSATAANGNVNPGWDVSLTGGSTAVWRIYESQSTPLLRSFLTPLTLSDTTATYNGIAQSGSLSVPAGVSAASARNAGTYAGYFSGQQGYDITGGSLTITPAALTLSTSNVTKTYDGGLTAAGTAAVSGGTLFSGDSLSGGSFAFTDKNAGSGTKTVTVSGITVTDGNGGTNYTVTYASNTTSTITPLASLAWSGTTTGVWSDAANWGGIAVDGNNIQSLSWPVGTTVTYDLPGTTVINTLGNSGSLVMNSTGVLQIGSAAAHTSTVIGLSVQGGTLSGIGTLTSTTPIALSGGTIKGSGFTLNASLNHTGGTLAPGASPGSLSITGNYTMGPSAILQAEIGGATAGGLYDVLNVSGAATVDGTLEVLAYGGYSPTVSTSFPGILSATGGISGSFANKILPSGYTTLTGANQIDISYAVATASTATSTTATNSTTATDTVTASLITSTNLADPTSSPVSSSAPEPSSSSSTTDTSGSTTTAATSTSSGPVLLSGYTTGGNVEQFGSTEPPVQTTVAPTSDTAESKTTSSVASKDESRDEKKDEQKEKKSAKEERKASPKTAQKKAAQCS